MSDRFDTAELVTRWPRWFARLANRIVGWTDEYCAGGCGYPITRRFSREIERYGDTAIVAPVCSLESPCSKRIDEHAVEIFDYTNTRPDIIATLNELNAEGHPIPQIRLSAKS